MTTPSAAWTARAEKVGGATCHMLFDLSVTHPTPKTWYLATVDLATPEEGLFDPDVFDPGTFATGLAGTRYWGLVEEHSGVSASAALGGLGGEAGVSLTLINALGTGGPGRRFWDVFAENVPGYAEPYDLLTATLQCRVVWADLLSEPLTVGALLALQPGGYELSAAPGEPERVRMSFGHDTRRYRPLPRTILTTKRYAHLPDSMSGRPMPTWFGTDQRVPLIPLDADGGLFGMGNSPTATPLGGVTKLWTVRADPTVTGAGADQLVVMSVRITTGGEVVSSIAGNGSALDLKQVAQLKEVESLGAFLLGPTIWLRRKVSGTPAAGSLSAGLYLNADGLPGDQLVDPAATAEVDAAIVGAGASFMPFTIPFQANAISRAAYIFADRGFWLIVAHIKNGGGDLQIEIDSTGAYTKGYMATKTTATDEGWVLVGKQTRRGPVRTDFTGIGGLGRDVATGAIVLRPPVKV